MGKVGKMGGKVRFCTGIMVGGKKCTGKYTDFTLGYTRCFARDFHRMNKIVMHGW